MDKDWLEFVKAALRNPLEVSTVFPTRPSLAQRLLDYADFESTRGKIVEVGSGTGAITKYLEPRMIDRSRFVGVEIDPAMVNYLRHRFSGLRFESESAENLSRLMGPGSASVVVSSLPWTVFPAEVQERTLQAISETLEPGGRFVTYICLNAEFFPSARRFKEMLNRKFRSVTKSPLEWKNIPPATVYCAQK